MITGNDGGACVTYNGGLSWSSIYNQPTGAVLPCHHRQPHSAIASSARSRTTPRWAPERVGARGDHARANGIEPGGGESGYIAVNPTTTTSIFGGAIGIGAGNGRLIRYDHRTQETRIVTVWPEVQAWARGAESLKFRFQWTFPITSRRTTRRALRDVATWSTARPTRAPAGRRSRPI